MAHFNFVISQNTKRGHAGYYIDRHRMTSLLTCAWLISILWLVLGLQSKIKICVPENILLQKSTGSDLILSEILGQMVTATDWLINVIKLISLVGRSVIGGTCSDNEQNCACAWRSRQLGHSRSFHSFHVNQSISIIDIIVLAIPSTLSFYEDLYSPEQ